MADFVGSESVRKICFFIMSFSFYLSTQNIRYGPIKIFCQIQLFSHNFVSVRFLCQYECHNIAKVLFQYEYTNTLLH